MKPFAEANALMACRIRRFVIKSRGWLRSIFGWRRRSGLLNRCSAVHGTTGSAAAAGAGSRSTAGRSCVAAGALGTAATGTNWATATGALTAATSFSVGSQTHHNRDRSSSRKTKHTIHPDLPQFQDTEPNKRLPTLGSPTPPQPLSLEVLREEYFGRLGELLQVSL
jgi:hypothetical protein